MGDVQSGEYTLEHDQAHAECSNAVEVAAAQDALNAANEQVWHLQDQLQEAIRRQKKCEGRLIYAQEPFSWQDIFVPKIFMHRENVYTICMQSGYKYAFIENRIFRAVVGGVGMVDMGLFKEDIK